MPPKKTNKRKSNKKKISMPKIKILPKNNNMLTSSLLLFLITIAAIINVFYLWTNQDNESLFLFILIAFIVYTEKREKNMILVLGIPFVVVNLLIYARKQFNSEGFEDISGGCDLFLTDADDISRCKQLMTGDSTPELMISWVKGPERFIPTTDISFDGPFRDRVILINNRTDPNTDDDNKQYIKEKIVQHINDNESAKGPSELFKKYFKYLSDRSGGGGGDDGTGTGDDLDDD